MNLQAQVLWCITFLYFFSSIPDLYALLDFIYNGVPLLLVDRQMALVRNSDIQCTGSSIVCFSTALTTKQHNRNNTHGMLCGFV